MIWFIWLLIVLYVVEDDEVTEDCIEMITLEFKSLTTLDNRPIDVRSVKDLEKKNQIINELGRVSSIELDIIFVL